MAKKISFNLLAPDRETYVKLREMDLNSGILGKFFGNSEHVSVYIAGVIVIGVAGAGLVATLCTGGATAVETWKIITPIITMVLGFLFGKNTSQ